MSIKKVFKYIPSSLRYNHYIHKFIFFKNEFLSYIDKTKYKNTDFSNNHISLTVGDLYQLPNMSGKQLLWESDNENVLVDENGRIKASKNVMGKEANAIIKATYKERVVKKYFITIVDWRANKSNLEILKILPKYKLLAKHKSKIFFSISKSLYVTTDGFKTKKCISRLPVLPAQSPPMLVTPKGYFIVGERKIFWSEDLNNWELVQKVAMHGVKGSFDYYYNNDSEICYIYYAEYSCINSNRHKVYRGIIDNRNEQTWSTIIDFYSIDEYNNDNSLLLQTARHIHIVKVDQTNGNLFVGVGDKDEHSKIMFSVDNGETFQIMGIGSQEWRTLSIWFTEKYVYWNMDSHEPQKIFRISKEKLKKRELFDYMKINNISEVINIEKETIAHLYNGAMFTSCDVFSDDGDKITIMAAAPEGNLRDMQGRVFGIKEHNDGRVFVQELISVSPKDESADYKTNMFTQLIPEFQDESGYIYFSTRNLKYNGIVKAKLNWDKI